VPPFLIAILFLLFWSHPHSTAVHECGGVANSHVDTPSTSARGIHYCPKIARGEGPIMIVSPFVLCSSPPGPSESPSTTSDAFTMSYPPQESCATRVEETVCVLTPLMIRSAILLWLVAHLETSIPGHSNKKPRHGAKSTTPQVLQGKWSPSCFCPWEVVRTCADFPPHSPGA